MCEFTSHSYGKDWKVLGMTRLNLFDLSTRQKEQKAFNLKMFLRTKGGLNNVGFLEEYM